MIARHWTGVCKKESARDYIEHLQVDTFNYLKRINGFVKASILQRDIPEGTEFLIVTEWASIQAIKQFAGEHYETAVVPPKVQQMMIRFDDKVKHYEISFTS